MNLNNLVQLSKSKSKSSISEFIKNSEFDN